MGTCFGDTRVPLSVQHEAAQAELRDGQESMDLLISTEEDLQREMEKTPGPDTQTIQRDMETLRDQWLEVGGRPGDH